MTARAIPVGGHLHFDCASGAAGDMTLGALIDLGVPVEVIRDVLDRVGIGGDRLVVAPVVKGGIRAMNAVVRTEPRPGEGGHAHGGHGHAHAGEGGHAHGAGEGGHADAGAHHPHRHYRDIRRLVADADLDAGIATRALDIFDRIARAEAALHGTTPDEVAFHEVGAIDSIVDVVGAAAALAYLAPRAVTAASVALGHGRIECAHGVLPVPSPAAIAILREVGAVVEDGGVARELCTPTGAAILAHAVTRWGPMPAMIPRAVGYGAGDDDLPDRPNVMRAIAGEPAGEAVAGAGADTVYRIEANIDDMSPELCEHAAAAAAAAGAVDVWWQAIAMKKSRPALALCALAPPPALDAVVSAILRETTTIGVRYAPMSRVVLAREITPVPTAYGPIAVKVARRGDEVVNAAPELESCRAAATAAGVPLKEVFAAAIAAYREWAHSGPGA